MARVHSHRLFWPVPGWQDGGVSGVRVGIFPPVGQHATGTGQRAAALALIAGSGIDHVCVGDHVSFFTGAGSDGLVSAASLLADCPGLPCYVALYLLPLRHPVTVARQLATVAELAPGRLTFGVGIGGEDRHELEICGVDPATRGRRMDECLAIVRALLRGEPVSFEGRFFSLRDALIVPAPSPPVPLVVGGRSDAAVRRDPAGFHHALNVWCGFGATREAARGPLAARMQAFYQMPFEPFERYSPYGTPADVADFLAPYVEAGCSAFNVIACADDDQTAVAAVGELRRLLADAR
jgi:alkanesulfonate monooxygenase SsuD/methylene tetrahydromethanopterin reductase-like flavin-dependent oxidoreductase (luciferase family)